MAFGSANVPGSVVPKAKELSDPRNIDGVEFNGTADISHYAACSTGAATVEKSVTLTGFKLVPDARIAVKFANANTAASPTLNVNSTGAKAICYADGRAGNSGIWGDGQVAEFIYDGTNWLMLNSPQTGTGLPEGIHAIRPQSADLTLGNVSGGGLIFDDVLASVSAVPKSGNIFFSWKENGQIVSKDEIYSFLAKNDRTLTAEFGPFITWEKQSGPLPEKETSWAEWMGAAYGDGVIVALQREQHSENHTMSKTRTVAYSTDGGNTWNTSTLPVSDYWGSIAYGNGVFLVTTRVWGEYGTGTKCAYSTDGGKTWKTSALPSNKLVNLIYGNGEFLARDLDTGEVFGSKDGGKTWSKYSTLPDNSWCTLTYGGGTYILTSRSDNNVSHNSQRVLYSTDAKIWKESKMPSSGAWYCLAYGNGTFVAATSSMAYGAYSKDGGITWVKTDAIQKESISNNVSFENMVYGNGVFIVSTWNDSYSGSTAVLLYSKDFGKTWEETILPLKKTWFSIVYTGSSFVAIPLGNYNPESNKNDLGSIHTIKIGE